MYVIFSQRIKLISPSVFTSLYTFLWVNSEFPKQRSAAIQKKGTEWYFVLCPYSLWFYLLILWIKSLRAIKEIYWAVLFWGAVYCAVNDGSNIYFWEWNFHNVTIEIKANVHYFSVVLFIMFYMVILHVTFYPNPFKSTLSWNHLFSTTLLN